MNSFGLPQKKAEMKQCTDEELAAIVQPDNPAIHDLLITYQAALEEQAERERERILQLQRDEEELMRRACDPGKPPSDQIRQAFVKRFQNEMKGFIRTSAENHSKAFMLFIAGMLHLVAQDRWRQAMKVLINAAESKVDADGIRRDHPYRFFDLIEFHHESFGSNRMFGELVAWFDDKPADPPPHRVPFGGTAPARSGPPTKLGDIFVTPDQIQMR